MPEGENYSLTHVTVQHARMLSLSPVRVCARASLRPCAHRLTQSVRNIYNLVVLEVPNNRLSRLPKELGYLSSLATLIVANNRLRRLPKSLRHIHGLRRVIAAANRITFFPPWLFTLQELEVRSCGAWRRCGHRNSAPC